MGKLLFGLKRGISVEFLLGFRMKRSAQTARWKSNQKVLFFGLKTPVTTRVVILCGELFAAVITVSVEIDSNKI